MSKKMIFNGRNRVRFSYSRFGYTRGNGTVWHGGLDIDGLDEATIRMPYYTYKNGSQKAICGTVTRARIVTDKSNKTWEWGWYICVQLDSNQTPDTVNFLYFCHCSRLLVAVGDKVKSGDELAIMGNTGNAALASPPFDHVHFEARANAQGVGVDPTAYTACDNAVGTYGSTPTKTNTSEAQRLEMATVGPMSTGDAESIQQLAVSLGISCTRKSV